VVRLLRRWFRRDDQLSSRWVQDYARSLSRIEFEGPRIKFPICKVKNEHPLWNTHKLRKVG
jgi:hypothetical protein